MRDDEVGQLTQIANGRWRMRSLEVRSSQAEANCWGIIYINTAAKENEEGVGVEIKAVTQRCSHHRRAKGVTRRMVVDVTEWHHQRV